MFCKIDYKFNKPNFLIKEITKSFVQEDNKGIFYHEIDCLDKDEFYKIIPEQFRGDFGISYMSINREIPPHIDNKILASINFYITTQEAETVFYKLNTNDPKIIKLHNQSDGCIFNLNDLQESSSFVARENDVWLLDVKKIHGVRGSVTSRSAVVLNTSKHSYEDVKAMLSNYYG